AYSDRVRSDSLDDYALAANAQFALHFYSFFQYYANHQNLHSFPTRRSSDLTKTDGCEEPAEFSAYPEFDRVRQEVQPLGQLRDSLIVAVDSSGLIVIDQHVAHERVLFETYLRQELEGRLDIDH